jgi:hypothetical protein
MIYIYMNAKTGYIFLSSGKYCVNKNIFKDSSSDRWFTYIGEL